MRHFYFLLSLLSLVGCAHTQTATDRYDAISRYLTPRLIDRHLVNASAPSPNRNDRAEDGRLVVDFDGHCLVTIGSGSSLLTEADYKSARGGFFASVLGEGLFPKIGRRAYIAGIEQNIVLFTTTDGRFDIRIEPRGTPETVDVVSVAGELSDLYDGRAKP